MEHLAPWHPLCQLDLRDLRGTNFILIFIIVLPLFLLSYLHSFAVEVHNTTTSPSTSTLSYPSISSDTTPDAKSRKKQSTPPIGSMHRHLLTLQGNLHTLAQLIFGDVTQTPQQELYNKDDRWHFSGHRKVWLIRLLPLAVCFLILRLIYCLLYSSSCKTLC